jgi:DNA-binding NtrC family response regulator
MDMTNVKVLVIDDDEQLRRLLVYQINKAGFQIAEAGSVREALLILEKQEISVVLTDVHLPDGNGIELTQMIKAAYPDTEVIAITSQGRISDGVKAIKNGAFDYLEKGDDSNRLLVLINQAAEKALLQKRISSLEKEVSEVESRKDIIGQNAAEIDKAILIIKAIHSPLRQRILQLIFAQGRATVTEIFTRLELEQAIASQHLAILKNAGLVHAQREGKSVYYSANYPGIEMVITFVQQLLKK